MLDDVQDEVIETVREAWPADGTHAASASAYVEWSDAALSIGYRYDSGRVIASHTVTKTDVRG